jgi:hypothetical protein
MMLQTLARQGMLLIGCAKDPRLPTALPDLQYHSKIQSLNPKRTARVKTGGPAFRPSGCPVKRPYARQSGRVGTIRFSRGYSQGGEKKKKKK